MSPGRPMHEDQLIAAFDRLCTALSRFYRVMVIDTGNNVRSANWRAATGLADCLVIPTTVQRDVADSGLWMLDHLIRIGRADLAANAVAIVSCADPHTDPALLEEISARYRQVVRTVEMPPPRSVEKWASPPRNRQAESRVLPSGFAPVSAAALWSAVALSNATDRAAAAKRAGGVVHEAVGEG